MGKKNKKNGLRIIRGLLRNKLVTGPRNSTNFDKNKKSIIET